MADILNRVVRVDYRPLQNVESSVSAAIATAMRLQGGASSDCGGLYYGGHASVWR